MKAPDSVAVVLSGFVTVMSTFPALWGGVKAEIFVALENATDAAFVVPKVTLAPL